MFGKKKDIPQIDKQQLELIQNAQRRIKQKKRLYIHFVVFLIGSLILVLANIVLGIGKDLKLFDIDWFVFGVLAWFSLLLYHTFNVFVTHKFMGKQWEQKQLDTLIVQQQQRIDKLKEQILNTQSKDEAKEMDTEDTSEVKKNSELTIIVAAGENDALGKDNKLIWHLSDDLKRFKSLTNEHHIIMGRKTFESFPKLLPNRTHVVITSQVNYKVPEGVVVVNSLENAIRMVKNDKQPFVIGGGEIYKQAMDLANKIELTRVHSNFEADTFFPKIHTSKWKEIHNTFHNKDDNHEYAFSFITYLKK